MLTRSFRAGASTTGVGRLGNLLLLYKEALDLGLVALGKGVK